MGRPRKTHPRLGAGAKTLGRRDESWVRLLVVGVVRIFGSIASGQFDPGIFGMGAVQDDDMADHAA